MERMIWRQVSFLILFALVIVLLMGLIFYSNSQAQDKKMRFLEDWDWEEEMDEDWITGDRSGFDIRYNRVEGLFLGLKLKQEYWRRRYPDMPFVFGSVGYAFAAKELEYSVGFEKGFFDEFRFALGGEYYRRIETPDTWIIPSLENSLAAVLIREDFHDFYSIEGGSAYIMQNLTKDILLKGAYHITQMDSIKRYAKWSLFGGKKTFRDNPRMDAGELKSLEGTLVVDTRNSKKRTTNGWYIQAAYEYAGEEMEGDFDFERLLVDLRRYQPLGWGQGFDVRIRAGSSKGILPWQKSYHLGGISTLRGFPYKAFPAGPMLPGANRMILMQFEYRMGSQNFPDEVDFGILDYFNIILFTDIGWTGSADQDMDFFEGFEVKGWSTWKNDVGIALANRSGNIRFEVARRTDTAHKPFVLYFRLSRAF